jgi:peptidoglycan/xylan/chitin deacetylase (PgdA/CDA1 family)
MPLRLPAGKRLAVNIGVDFDAMCAFSGHMATLSPSILSRGEFDAEVGTPRLLRLFAKHGIPTTWCTPGHTLITFPDRVREVIDSGHEIAAHGIERFNVHMKQHEDVWFATLSDIYDRWSDN